MVVGWWWNNDEMVVKKWLISDEMVIEPRFGGDGRNMVKR